MPSTNWAFFGIVPWLALFALIHGPSRRAIVARCQVDPAFTALVLAPGTYVAGALLTAPLGMDLFIQNARYPLTFVTGWGLLATAWIASLDFTGASAPRAVKWRRWGLAAVLVLATGQMLYEVRRTARVRRALVRSAEGPTDEFNARKAIRAAEPWLAPDQAILSFRQSDWGVFGPRPFFAHHHPRLLPVYEASTVEDAEKALRALGIGAFTAPVHYAEPFFDETALFDLAADPSRVKVVAADGYYAVFVLRERRIRQSPLTREPDGPGPLAFRKGRLARALLGVRDPRHVIEAATRTILLEVPPSLAPCAYVHAYVDDVTRWSPPKDIARDVAVSVTVRGQGLAGGSLVEDTPVGPKERSLRKGLLPAQGRRISAVHALRPDTRGIFLRYELQAERTATRHARARALSRPPSPPPTRSPTRARSALADRAAKRHARTTLACQHLPTNLSSIVLTFFTG